MSHLRSTALPVAIAVALMIGCGSQSNSVHNPFRDFQIDDELSKAIYTYQFPNATVDMQFVAAQNQVLGISTSTDHSITVGFHGPDVNSTTFDINDAETDDNHDGNFFDDPALTLTPNSNGTFSSTGDELTLVGTVMIGLIPFDFGGTGNLVSTRAIGG